MEFLLLRIVHSAPRRRQQHDVCLHRRKEFGRIAANAVDFVIDFVYFAVVLQHSQSLLVQFDANHASTSSRQLNRIAANSGKSVDCDAATASNGGVER